MVQALGGAFYRCTTQVQELLIIYPNVMCLCYYPRGWYTGVALELASQELGLNILSAVRRRGLGNPHSVSHLQPESKLRPGDRHCPTRPNRSSRAGPGTKLREHCLNVPKVNQTEGLRNPHSVTRLQPNQPPARNPPLSDATKSLQARGDRDRTPTRMAVILVEGRHPNGILNHS
jgi:hypothetical protein